MKKAVFLLIVSLVFASCGPKRIEEEQLQKRDGIAYEVNSETPYSGEVVHHFLSGGNSKEIWNFKNGKKVQSIQYNDKGDRVNEYNWDENGKEHGAYFDAFSSTGKPEIEANYIHGKLDGEYTEWYENGQIKKKMFYKNDVPEGKCQFWLENGQLSSETDYKPGNLYSFTHIYDGSDSKKELLKTVININSLIKTFISLYGKDESQIQQLLGLPDSNVRDIVAFENRKVASNETEKAIKYEFSIDEHPFSYCIVYFIQEKNLTKSIRIVFTSTPNYHKSAFESVITKHMKELGFNSETGMNSETKFFYKISSVELYDFAFVTLKIFY